MGQGKDNADNIPLQGKLDNIDADDNPHDYSHSQHMDASLPIREPENNQEMPNNCGQLSSSISIPLPLDLNNSIHILERHITTSEVTLRHLSLQIDECIHDRNRIIRTASQIQEKLTHLNNYLVKTNKITVIYLRVTTFVTKRAWRRGDLGPEDVRLLVEVSTRESPDVPIYTADITTDITRGIAGGGWYVDSGVGTIPYRVRPLLPTVNTDVG